VSTPLSLLTHLTSDEQARRTSRVGTTIFAIDDGSRLLKTANIHVSPIALILKIDHKRQQIVNFTLESADWSTSSIISGSFLPFPPYPVVRSIYRLRGPVVLRHGTMAGGGHQLVAE
jgi:hypothetical protein